MKASVIGDPREQYRYLMIRPRLGATFAQPKEAAALHESRHAEDDTGGGVGYDYRTLI